MSTIKYALNTVVVSMVLALGLAVPVGAQANGNIGSDNSSATQNNTTTTTRTDNSVNADDGSNAFTISGDCNGVFISEIEQDQSNDQGALNAAGLGHDNSSSSDQSSNQSQNANPSFTLHCERVTNNTMVAEAAARKQVAAAPKGGVDAGGGGTTSSLVSTLMGFGGSVGSLGYGVLRLRRR